MSITIKIRENDKYSSVDYWNSRYSTEEEYDWLGKSSNFFQGKSFLINIVFSGDYNIFKDLIRKHVSKQDRILMVGCGNSKLR